MKFERFIKNALTRSVFELEKCSSFFFKWVRVLPEIDWYHFQGASPASNIDKDPYKVKCHIRSQCTAG